MASRKTPEVNAGSMADIAFLLLIFFLMTTTMDRDNGLQRRLPPMPDENQTEDTKLNKRNSLIILINTSDKLFAGGEPLDISQLKDKVKEFLINPNSDPHLPERVMKEIEGFGTYPVSKGVISLQNDRGTSYNAYIEVQNELVRAFNEVRNSFARTEFGKDYDKLDEVKQKIVRQAIPLNISEAEPKDVTKRKR